MTKVKVTPQTLKVLFVVNPDLIEDFILFLEEQGLVWENKSWESLVQNMEQQNNLLLLAGDPFVEKVLNRFEDLNLSNKFIYLFGCDEYLSIINPIGNFIYNRRKEWKEFLMWYKRQTNEDFKII